jgi:hypothetical protein
MAYDGVECRYRRKPGYHQLSSPYPWGCETIAEIVVTLSKLDPEIGKRPIKSFTDPATSTSMTVCRPCRKVRYQNHHSVQVVAYSKESEQ